MWDEIIKILIYLAAGGAITFFVTKYFRQKKSLAYQIVSKMSLINVRPEIRDKIKIDYDGTPAENIYSFKVRVINDGNVPIKNQPILFGFDKEAKVLAADYNTEPEREFGEITKEKNVARNEVKFVIGLLNPKSKKEQVEFDFLTIDNRNDDIKLHAKGENLKVHEVPSMFDKVLALPVVSLPFYLIFCLLVFSGLSYVAESFFPQGNSLFRFIFVQMLFVAAFVLIIFYLVKKYEPLDIIQSLERQERPTYRNADSTR